ncbi:hypothetical protein [Streptomyces sp. NPDC046261]|uniref:hypothetical protein n=1 Tax=Streptomyces sp. NPDC046261 TaxID=3157200 RepID=UPI0033D59295
MLTTPLAVVGAGPRPAPPAENDGTRLVRAAVTVDAEDPFLAGHYPGFPLVPGFGLVQYVHDLVTGADGAPPRAAGHVVLKKARFLSPVRPGQQLLIEARVERTGDGVRVAAGVSADGRPAAELSLHYPREPA